MLSEEATNSIRSIQCHLCKIQQYTFYKEANSHAPNTWDTHQAHQNDYKWGSQYKENEIME